MGEREKFITRREHNLKGFRNFTSTSSKSYMQSTDQYQKRRLISSYFSVVISIGAVLFVVGFLGILLFNSAKVVAHFKEQIAFTIFINDTAKPIEIKQLQKSLQLRKETKSIRFVSKEEAAETHANDIGEDFMEFLGYNPLLSSIDVYFNAEYVDPAFLAQLKANFEERPYVNEVFFDQPLLTLLDENINKLTKVFLFLSVLFVFIAILLINSSIRLSVYSKRLIIKTMQLVGATKRFIRWPFIWQHLLLGFYGALLATLGLGSLLYQIDLRYPILQVLSNPVELAMVFGGIFAIGILITAGSTFLATSRYLNLTTDAVQ